MLNDRRREHHIENIKMDFEEEKASNIMIACMHEKYLLHAF